MNLQKTPQNHGHRGARGLFPENSLIAFQAAIEHGCDAIEVDLCVTADNQLILHHDPILSPELVRNPDGTWINSEIIIRQITAEEIKLFDVGQIRPNTEYAKRFPCQKAVNGTRIPLLEEFAALVRTQSDVFVFNLELKNTPYQADISPPLDVYAGIVVEKLQSLDIVSQTLLQSFDWRLPLAVKTALPELKIGLLTNQQLDGNPLSPVKGQAGLWTHNLDLSNFGSIPEMIHSTGAEVWSSNALDLCADDVNKAHDLDLEVCVWTVNTTQKMQKMINYRVDAITTDYPDKLNNLITDMRKTA